MLGLGVLQVGMEDLEALSKGQAESADDVRIGRLGRGPRGFAPGPDAFSATFATAASRRKHMTEYSRPSMSCQSLARAGRVTGADYLLGRGCFLRSCCSRSSCAIPRRVPARRCGSHREG